MAMSAHVSEAGACVVVRAVHIVTSAATAAART